MRQCTVCGQSFDWQPVKAGRPPDTCSANCRRIRKARLSEQSRRRAVNRGCPDDAHGTITGYSHYRCSCPKCTKWAREYKQHRRALQKKGA